MHSLRNYRAILCLLTMRIVNMDIIYLQQRRRWWL
jgi:hypothetical protein